MRTGLQMISCSNSFGVSVFEADAEPNTGLEHRNQPPWSLFTHSDRV